MSTGISFSLSSIACTGGRSTASFSTICSRVVRIGLHRHDVACEVNHVLTNLRGVHGERAVRRDRDPAVIQEVIQLQRHAAAVGFGRRGGNRGGGRGGGRGAAPGAGRGQ